MKKIIKHLTIAAAASLALSLSSCNPVTGETLLYGSLEVVNEYSAPLGAVAVWTEPGGSGEKIWANPPGLNIEYGKGLIWSDVPAGTWSVFVGGSTIDNVTIAVGMTTTIVRTSGGGLTAGVPH